MDRKALFDAVRPFAPGGQLGTDHVPLIDALADAFGLPRAEGLMHPAWPGTITERIALELIGHEAIVPEAYKDSVGVWTWSVGITSRSGHSVERYKDKPQTLQHCLAVYLWLLRERYAPAVAKAFDGLALTEAQFGAALSFHYNTGAIDRAGWVKLFRAGQIREARAAFMEWRKPAEIIPRREKECALFFDGCWSGDGLATVYEVAKPGYSPKWSTAKRVDVRPALRAAMAA